MKNAAVYFAFVVLSFFSFCSIKKQKNKPVVWKETIGYFDPRRYRGGKMIYYTPNARYEVSYKYMTDFVYDLKYSMRYNVEDPNQFEIDYWNPIFIQGEKTFSTIARISGFQYESLLSGKGDVVTFYYYVDGKKQSKWAYMNPNFKTLYPGLSVGKCYRLEYWAENSHRNKLHLEEPANCDSALKGL